jgi:hypothetical protein
VWPSGYLWDCSPGASTRADCKQACNTNPDCYAYDTFSNVDEGLVGCCLFMDGNTGNGNSQSLKVCSVKQSGIFVRKINHFEFANSEYNI